MPRYLLHSIQKKDHRQRRGTRVPFQFHLDSPFYLAPNQDGLGRRKYGQGYDRFGVFQHGTRRGPHKFPYPQEAPTAVRATANG